MSLVGGHGGLEALFTCQDSTMSDLSVSWFKNEMRRPCTTPSHLRDLPEGDESRFNQIRMMEAI